MSLRLPRFPTPGVDGLKRSLLRYQTDDGVCVCLGDGSEPAMFPFVQFEVSRDGSVVAALEWLVPHVEAAEEECGKGITLLQVQKTTTGHVARLKTPDAEVIDLAWSPSMESIWFATGGSSPRFTYNIDILTERITPVAPGVSPKPSPDGQYLAFYGIEPHGTHILSIDTNRESFVTSGHPHSWSPDSRYLACLDVVGTAWQLYVYDLHLKKRIHTATTAPFAYWPTWFPDGNTLAFEVCAKGRAGSPSLICRAPIGGERYEQLTSGPRDQQPNVHPRFGYIAYCSRDSVTHSECNVWVMDPSTGERRRIGRGREASWLLVP